MRYYKSLSIFLLSVVVLGCATMPRKPDWVIKGSGAFKDAGKTRIYGYGVYGRTPNKAAQIEGAKMRARADIANTLSVNVQRLAKDFMEENKDWYNLNDTAGSNEYLNIVSKQLTDQTLIGAKQLDSWEDTKTGDLYILMAVEFNDDFYNQYKNTLRRVISEKHRAVVAERAEEALSKLEEAVEKQRQREDEILGIKK